MLNLVSLMGKGLNWHLEGLKRNDTSFFQPKNWKPLHRGQPKLFLVLLSFYARFSSFFQTRDFAFSLCLFSTFRFAFMLFVLVSTVLWIYYCLYLFRACITFARTVCRTSSLLLELRLVEEGITRKPCEYDGVIFCCVLVFTGFPMVPILPMTLSRATLLLLLFVDRRVESTFHLNTVQKMLPLSCYVLPRKLPNKTTDSRYKITNVPQNQLTHTFGKIDTC